MKWWSFAAVAASSLALLGAPATAVRPAERLPTIREDCREDSPPGYYHDAPPHYDEHRPEQYDKNAPAYGNDHVVGWDRGWTKKNPPPPWWNQRLRDNAVYEGCRDSERRRIHCEVKFDDQLPVEQQKDARCDIQLPRNYIHSTFGD
ncbi:hypothetical protein VFPBJ_08516 [Purpureocillium lilacinum]|uniref:Secreted protein n=1 Tax=Purpureocillium lilacinum TaxID=33203 RepID=A0A179GE92_PURLI|nr:hypothetical protein VFPBJ_08516 [Purpureocillium lilacinum]